MKKTMIAAALATTLTSTIAAGAQGVGGGVEDAALATGVVPAGRIFAGLFAPGQRPRFRRYVVRRHHASYTYGRAVVIGAVLPARGVTYHEVPAEFGVRAFSYAIVDGHPVLVDLTTRRIVDVID